LISKIKKPREQPNGYQALKNTAIEPFLRKLTREGPLQQKLDQLGGHSRNKSTTPAIHQYVLPQVKMLKKSQTDRDNNLDGMHKEFQSFNSYVQTLQDEIMLDPYDLNW
jgi:hypothetical protein